MSKNKIHYYQNDDKPRLCGSKVGLYTNGIKDVTCKRCILKLAEKIIQSKEMSERLLQTILEL